MLYTLMTFLTVKVSRELDRWRGRHSVAEAIEKLLEIAFDAGEPRFPERPEAFRKVITTTSEESERTCLKLPKLP